MGSALALVADKNAKMLPFYMLVPQQSNLPLEEEYQFRYDNKTKNPAILLQYHQSRFERIKENQIGLRIIAVNRDLSRQENASILAQTTLIKTGDIILSYRPEWYRTLRYSHIQLGISHAGVAYVEKNQKGIPTVYNIDMPLDAETIGANQRSTLSSKHYEEAPFLHILRPRGLTDEERENILSWAKMIRDRSPSFYPKEMRFNSDYTAPKFNFEGELGFVGDLGRLAYGIPLKKQTSMYCSEFAWTLLSLRKCNPDKEKINFEKDEAPSCISPLFAPMNIFGSIAVNEKSDLKKDRTLGLIDGPLLLIDRYTKGAAKKYLECGRRGVT